MYAVSISGLPAQISVASYVTIYWAETYSCLEILRVVGHHSRNKTLSGTDKSELAEGALDTVLYPLEALVVVDHAPSNPLP